MRHMLWGDASVIVECKSWSKSIAFDRGDPEAIRRRNSLINEALIEIDGKAQWLAEHPRGVNYDVGTFDDILPLVVTPFVEYIPSLSPRYWLKKGLPRVLNPTELAQSIREGLLSQGTDNAVPVLRS